MDSITEQSGEITITASWVIPAPRQSVYAIVSDFGQLATHFPRLARSARIVTREGNRLMVDVQAASFGRLFPEVRLAIHAELLPDVGYRCSTINHTFGTTGKEELTLHDHPDGTEILYAYTVNVRPRWLRPLYGWLVRRVALAFWKRNYLDPLTRLALQHQRSHRS